MVRFRSEKISDSVTRIRGITEELMYLVEGQKRALLIDTGTGVGSLKAYVETLTDKPYTVVLTHGHVDHAGGAPEFQTDIFMNPADNKVLSEHGDLSLRKASLSQAPAFGDVTEDDYIPIGTKPFLPLKHGDVFDLGDITVEAYACPGHTPGSMVLLLKEERTLLLGDACNPFTFLFLDHSSGIPDYKRSLETLRNQLAGKFDRVYLSHGPGDGPKEMLDGVIGVCDDILAGRTDDIPFEFMGAQALIAKALDPMTMQRVDGGIGNIVYREKP